MGIVSKMKERWKLAKEYDIKDLVKNIDPHAIANVYFGAVYVIPTSNKKYWEIIDALNNFYIDYETYIYEGKKGIKVIIHHHKHHEETFEDEESDEEPDIFNSEGGFDL